MDLNHSESTVAKWLYLKLQTILKLTRGKTFIETFIWRPGMLLKHCFRSQEEYSGALMITPTDHWFYLIIFLWSKNLKRICQNNYLDVGSEKELLSLNYRISYKRKNVNIWFNFFLLPYYQSNSNCIFSTHSVKGAELTFF